MKTQITPTFPRRVVGGGRIEVSFANGVVTISDQGIDPLVIQADSVIPDKTGLIAIIRNNPAVTNLILPSVLNQGSIPLSIIDWSTNIVNHQINLTPFGAQTIKLQPVFSMFSNAAELAGLTLYPSTALNGWFIAP